MGGNEETSSPRTTKTKKGGRARCSGVNRQWVSGIKARSLVAVPVRERVRGSCGVARWNFGSRVARKRK